MRIEDPFSMKKSLCVLALGVAFSVTAGRSAASAQTVVVWGGPANASIEVSVNAGPVQTATADRSGDARLDIGRAAGGGEAAVRVVVDRCDAVVRVHIVTAGAVDSQSGCSRTDVPGLYVMRSVTSFLVDLSGSSPNVLLRQGPVPPEWLVRTAPGAALATVARFATPAGVMIHGGGGFGSFGSFTDVACGSVACSGSSLRGSIGAGAVFWITPVIGAQASVMRPQTLTLSGGDSTYTFDSSFDARLLTVDGIVGAPLGRVRPYGVIGAAYHRALFTQSQTIADSSVTLDGVTTVVPGGTQRWQIDSRGWGLQFGGGLEVWVNRRMAIYGEVRSTAIRGTDRRGSEGEIDSRVTFAVAGGRIRIGR